MAIGQGAISEAPVGAEAGGGPPEPIDLADTLNTGDNLNIQPVMLSETDGITLGESLVAFNALSFHLADALLAGTTYDALEIRNYRDTIAARAAIDTQFTGRLDATDGMKFGDTAQIIQVLELIDVLVGGDALDTTRTKAVILASALLASDAASNNQSYLIDIAVAIATRSFMSYGFDFELSDGAELGDAFVREYNAVVALADEMQLSDMLEADRQLGMIFTSSALLGDIFGTQATLAVSLFDSMVGQVLFKLGDDVFQGWVFAVETSAFSEYANYPFNSVVTYRGRPYGAAEDGIYLLEGGDDAGTAIDAAVKTHLTSMRERAIKDVKAAYIGYTSTGQMVLKVTVDRGGQLHEYWYADKYGASTSMRTNRFNVQRGLRSTYWQFELVNQDGADFELEDFTILYEVLTRRIR